jgi:hypothetical protein
MAAPATRVQIFYNYKARGFSEVLWNTNIASGCVNPVGSAPTKVLSYLAKRLPLLNKECEVVYARASVVGSPRQFTIQNLLGQGRVGQNNEKGSAPDDVIILKLFGGAGSFTPFHLHAFPSKIVQANLLTDLGAYQGLLQSFGDYLKFGGDGWIINTSISAIPGPRTYYNIGISAPNLNRGYNFIPPVGGAPFPALPIGTVISVSGMGNDQFGYNGRKIITNFQPSAITVGGAIPVGTAVTVGAKFFVVPNNAVAISDVVPWELGERKCGKVFGVPAGRRRNTLSLRR